MPLKTTDGDPSLSLGGAGFSGVGRFDLSGWSPVAAREARVRKRRSTYICRIDVMGVAAVFFVLFSLFMAALPPFHHLSVDLFHATTGSSIPNALREDAMKVFVTHDGTIYFNEHRIPTDELPQKIHEWVDFGSEKRVYIYADVDSRYRDVKTVLEEIRSAGVENITFLTFSGQPTGIIRR